MDELHPPPATGAERLHLLRLAADAGASLTRCEVQYRGPIDGTVVRQTLDAMTAVYDRRAGVTHLLGEAAVTILSALDGGPASVGEVAARLGLTGDEVDAVLTERLDELVASGLVEVR